VFESPFLSVSVCLSLHERRERIKEKRKETEEEGFGFCKTLPQPTRKPINGEINSCANSYAPPSFGIDEPNSAKPKAVKEATIPASIIEITIAGSASYVISDFVHAF
jgi:hypothetical protein